MEPVRQVDCAPVAHGVYLGLEYLVRTVGDGRDDVLVVGLDGRVHGRVRHHHVFELLFGHFVFQVDRGLFGFEGVFRGFGG